MRKVSSILSVSLAVVACRSSADNNNNNNNGDAGSGSGSGSGAVTIQQVQSDSMPPGTPVSLAGVVVTAIDTYGAKTGNLWVEEPEGGPLSGVLVYNAPVAMISGLSPGDIVSIDGAEKDDFALTGSDDADTTGRTDTELEPVSGGMMTVTKTGTGTVPTPAMVDALMIGQLTDADAQGSDFSGMWKQWDGVLVTLTNVAAESAPKSFGSTTPVPLDNYDVAITGVIKAESSLAGFPDGVTRNTCFASVTGVVDYFYDYLILPRATADMVVGGTGCATPESSQTDCSDGVDNDANGFADCGDDSCIASASYTGCRSTTTVTAIDGALPTGGIEVDNAYVTAITSDGSSFWIATSATAASGNGLYVYGAGTTLPTLAVGDQVTVIGTVEDYKPSGNTATQVLRELEALSVTVTTPGTAAGTPVTGVTAATLTVEATGRPYVGSLVTLTNASVVTLGTTANHNTGSLSSGGTTVTTEGDIDVVTSAVGTCFASITGIWTYDVYNDQFALEPLAEGTTGGTCN